MESGSSPFDNSVRQETILHRSTRDPLLLVIFGTITGLSILVASVVVSGHLAPVIAEIPWFQPFVITFVSLTTLCASFLALERYYVLRDPTSLWIGMGFAAYAIGQIFNVLVWPDLLPGGRSIAGHLTNTPALITDLNLTINGILLLAAVLVGWPKQNRLTGLRWLGLVVGWLIFVTAIYLLIVRFEQFLPEFVRPDGTFTPLVRWSGAIILTLYVAGTILSLRHYWQSQDILVGSVALLQAAVAFIMLMTIISGKRYDVWWYLERVILVAGCQIVLFSLLSDYVRLFRREREGRLMLDAILENIPVGLAITGGSDEFRLIHISRHGLEMNRQPADRLDGGSSGADHGPWKIFSQDGRTPSPREQLPDYRAGRYGEEIRNTEMVMETRDGRKIPVLVNAAPIRNASGEITAAITIWVDITEHKQAEAALQKYASELERANRDLQNFTVISSHDLQEPLRKIEALGDSVLHGAPALDEGLVDRISRMRKSAQQMRKMVDGLLQLALLSSETRMVQSVDLNQTAYNILVEKQAEMRQSGGMVEVNELPVIEADPIQIRWLLQHMVENALKFQPPEQTPRVKISSRQKDSTFVQILIDDNGIGFDEAYAGQLFKPFERLVGKNQPQYDGVGIGLAICRRIVETHGGKIAVRSKPGEGTTFTIELPIHQ